MKQCEIIEQSLTLALTITGGIFLRKISLKSFYFISGFSLWCQLSVFVWLFKFRWSTVDLTDIPLEQSLGEKDDLRFLQHKCKPQVSFCFVEMVIQSARASLQTNPVSSMLSSHSGRNPSQMKLRFLSNGCNLPFCDLKKFITFCCFAIIQME